MRFSLMLVMLVAFSGCVSAEMRESVLALQADHATYRAATVPNPEYDGDGQAAVMQLGEVIADHLDKLEELTR